MNPFPVRAPHSSVVQSATALCGVLGSLLCPPSLAQSCTDTCSSATTPTDIAYGGEVREVFALDECHVWRAEDGGRIRYSVDGGANWCLASTPDDVRDALLDIFFLDDQEGWAVGKEGVALHSTDGGATWDHLLYDDGRFVDENNGYAPYTLWGVQFTTVRKGYIVGEGFFKRIATGYNVDPAEITNWIDVNLAASQDVFDCGAPTPCTDHQITLTSSDFEFYAIDFMKVTGSGIRGLASAECKKELCDLNCDPLPGIVFKTSNGSDWTLVTQGLSGLGIDDEFEAWDVEFEPNPTSIDGATAVMVGGVANNDGRIFASSDSGAMWSEEFHEQNGGLTDCPNGCVEDECHWCDSGALFPCRREVYVAGIDCQTPASGFPTFYGVTVLDSSVAVACSYGGGLFERDLSLLTLDYWRDRSDLCNFPAPLLGATAANGTTIWVSGTFGYLHKITFPSGAFTSVSQTPAGEYPFRLHAVAFENDDDGLVAGERDSITETNDGGATFTLSQAVTCPDGETLYDIAKAGSYGVAVGGGEVSPAVFEGRAYYVTGTGPLTWDESSLPSGTKILNGVDHVQGDEFWAVGNQTTVVRTVDGGENWAGVCTSGLSPSPCCTGCTTANVKLRAVAMLDEDTGFVVGTQTYTYTGGSGSCGVAFLVEHATSCSSASCPGACPFTPITWTDVTPAGCPPLWDVAVSGSSLSNATVYAVGDQGKVFYWDSGAFHEDSDATTLLDAMNPPAPNLYCVAIVPTNSNVYAGGAGGRLVKFVPGSPGTWAEVHSLTSKDILDLSFPSDAVGFAAAQALSVSVTNGNVGDGLVLRINNP